MPRQVHLMRWILISVSATRSRQCYRTDSTANLEARHELADSWMIAARFLGWTQWGAYNQGTLKGSFPALHEQISAQAWEGLGRGGEGTEDVMLLRALAAGVRYNDQPTDFVNGSMAEIEKAVNVRARSVVGFLVNYTSNASSTTKESHFGVLQHWHAQVPTPRTGTEELSPVESIQPTMVLTNAEVARLIHGQAEIWWKQSVALLPDSEKSLFVLGHLLHMLQDSYAPAHTIRVMEAPDNASHLLRSCGQIAHFTGYTFQNHDKHKAMDYLTCESDLELCNCARGLWDRSHCKKQKAGTRNRRTAYLYSCSVEASRQIQEQWLLCEAVRNVSGDTMSACDWSNVGSIIREHIAVPQKYADDIAGGSELAMALSKDVMEGLAHSVGRKVQYSRVDIGPCGRQSCQEVQATYLESSGGCLVDIVRAIPDGGVECAGESASICGVGQYCNKGKCEPFFHLLTHWNKEIASLHLGLTNIVSSLIRTARE